MLPRPDAPATRLAYTTADMSERLAKRKAQEQFKTNALKTLSNYKPKEDKPWYEDVAGAIGGAIKTVYDNMPMSNPVSTPINMGGNAGVSMGGQGTVKSLVTEPARLAVRRAVGDITAIPRVGADSPSYTADQIREQGVVPGVLGAAIDYSQFIPVVAKGAGFTGDAVNAYKLAMMERQANPFPALRGASNVIDVVPGSRLPARVVDAPAPPATRLGNALAQMTLDARAAQGGVRDAGVIRFPGGEPTPELPAAQLSQPTFRERKVPESTKITVEFNGQPSQQEPQAFVIRAFDPTFNKYKGALTMEWDPQKGKAIVDGLGTTDAMVVPQILASAAHVVRKFYGNIQFPLEPSTNLSVHSRPLVERLQQAGLVDPNFGLPEPSQLNRITKQTSEPSDFAAPDAFFDTQVINPLAYQPTYNDVLKKLVESKRQAKLQGEYGKLATSSKKLQTIEEQRDLNYAANYRANMEQFGFPVHPLFEQLSDARMNILLDEIKNDTQRGASILLDVWNKIDPAVVENAGVFADSYAPTKQNLLKFPQLLQDSNLIDGFTRQRLLVELQDLLE
jgi:hypothetical protein